MEHGGNVVSFLFIVFASSQYSRRINGVFTLQRFGRARNLDCRKKVWGHSRL